MSVRARRRLGIALLAGSTLTGVILQLSTGEMVVDDARSQASDVGLFHSILITHTVTFKMSYAIPLAIAALIGFLCLVAPERQPPKLR